MRRFDVLIAAIVLALLSAMVVATRTYPDEARLVPLVIGIPAAILAAWQFVRELTGRSMTGPLLEDLATPNHRAADAWKAIAWIALFSLATLAGGFVVGSTLAVMATYRLWLRESWRVTVVGGAIALFVSYVCFERVLGLLLFPGWLSEWIQ